MSDEQRLDRGVVAGVRLIPMPNRDEQMAQIERIVADPNAYVAETRRLREQQRHRLGSTERYLWAIALPLAGAVVGFGAGVIYALP